MQNRLFCFYQRTLVGEISFDASLRLQFAYSESWLDNEQRFSISLSMPLREEPFGHEIANPFFENLLPEEAIRATIGRMYKIPQNNIFQFFTHFGDELAGALAVYPQPEIPQPGPQCERVELKRTFIDQAIENGQSLYAQVLSEHGMKFSLAGAQEKFPIIYEDQKLWIPLEGQPTSHIVKVDMSFNNSQTVINEYLTMRLAQKVGLNTAKVDIIRGKYPLFLVSRFDRDTTNGVMRVHQEDFCQAQAYPSPLKYEDTGGPEFVQNYELLRRESRHPIQDLKQILKWLAFNLLIGNNDSHSKNLSFLWDGKKPSLAPFYDLLSTAVYGSRFDTRFAFKIGRVNQFDKMKKSDFLAFENRIRVRPQTFQKILLEMASSMKNNIGGLEDEAKMYISKATMGTRLCRLITKRIERIEKILS